MPDLADRRPLASRQTAWARRITLWLVSKRITPNAISILSMVAAACAGATFAWGGPHPAGLILAAVFCQLRLMCNLFDGLVAVEGGKAAPDGPFWNEAPDRMSDLLILAGFGAAAGRLDLGLLAAALAIFTAYLRELGRANNLGNDFSGPFAKPQRMALVTATALLAAATSWLGFAWPVLLWGLVLLILGTAITILRRALHQIRAHHRHGLPKNR